MLLNGFFLEILVKSSLPFSGKDIIPQIGMGSSGFFDVYKNFPERFLCVNYARGFCKKCVRISRAASPKICADFARVFYF